MNHPSMRRNTVSATVRTKDYPDLPPLPSGFRWFDTELLKPVGVCIMHDRLGTRPEDASWPAS